MYQQIEILALITARGGSKGVPGKNLRPLNGKPLIAYTIEAAKHSGYIDRVVVSTDAEEIAAAAKRFGAEVPFLRPAKFAGDASPSSEAIIHALEWFETNERKKFPVFCLLQPTSPFRTAKHIDAAMDKFFSSDGAESLISVCPSHKSPYWAQVVTPEGYLRPLIEPRESYTRRQDIPATYDINGAIYVANTDAYLHYKNFLMKKTVHYEMGTHASLDIDTETDMILAETLCARQTTHE